MPIRTKRRRNHSARKSTSSRESSKEARDGIRESYMAYAVAADGTRQVLDARSIVVDVGDGEVEIDLTVAHPILFGQLHLVAHRGAYGEGVLVVGHADSSSIHVGVELAGQGRFKRS